VTVDQQGLADDAAAALGQAYGAIPPDPSLAQLRAGLDEIAQSVPRDVSVIETTLGGVPGRLVVPPETSDVFVVYVHGGGWVSGSSLSHRDLAARIALSARCRTFVPDYRLAPEHRFPAALDDVIAAWHAGLEAFPEHAAVLMGDSSGANLALAAVFAGRRAGLADPVGVVTLSAITDVAFATESFTLRSDRDPVVAKAALEDYLRQYGAEDQVASPLVSPLRGELAGFPPVLMQVGSEEVLYDDTMHFAEAVERAGGRATVQAQAGMPHVHQMLWWGPPAAQEAIDQIGAFVGGLEVPPPAAALTDGA
jgi:epsilon-lactone hydrolase